MNPELNVLVVCGGTSSERAISLRSGRAVLEALRAYGYVGARLFDLREDNMGEILSARPDAVFLTLHGKGGEDGRIQGFLDLAGIPYTGSGVESSAVCMNKILTKQVLMTLGLPTAKFTIVRKERLEKDGVAAIAEEMIEQIGLPLVLKAPCEGSSIGVIIVREERELPRAIVEVFSSDDRLLAEEFLSGTEITLPILGNEEIMVLPDVEITSEREFYDYTAKYTQGMCTHIIPARISDAARTYAKEIGREAYRALRCRGLARIDFIVDERRGPMVIEINTLPGMTEMSLFPDSARAMGIEFPELCHHILSLCLEGEEKSSV